MDEAIRGIRARAVLLAILAATMLAALGASSASAVIVRLSDGKTLSYQPLRGARALSPFDEFFSNLDYNGGPVMASNTNYAIYWEPSGSPKYPADYQPGLNRYFEDLAHDSGGTANVDSVSSQYNDTAGEFASYNSHFGGALIDTDPYPANGCKEAPICITDAQIRAELKAYVEAHALPHDLTHEYFLLTPPGVEDCFQASGRECSAGVKLHAVYCAYHGNIPTSGGPLIYSNDPYVTGNFGCDDGNHPNGSTSDGVLQGGLSHEHNESITDPEPNNAWTDIGGSGGENGDKCRTFNPETEFGTPLGTAENGASYNQVINGHEYWYQQEWSNQTHQCLQRLAFSGEEPTATFTSAAGAGNEMKFDATGSTAPGGVFRYNWQFNDGPGLSLPTETSTPTVSHTFPAGGTYLVALTVFAENGTSIGTGKSVVVGTPPLPKVTKVAPTKGPAEGGTTVTITGANLSEATAVTFGSVPAKSFKVKSATSITAVSPAETAGTVDVTVTSPGGTSATSTADHFKFGPPTITEVSPNNGPIGGGTSVTVTGTGFALGTSLTSFKFAVSPAASVNCTSITTCTVVSPAHKAGIVYLKATVAGVSSVKTVADQFTYH
jgi:hypothetical protein